MTDNKRVVSPEWVTSVRGDRKLDERYGKGWGVSPAPVVRGASFTDFSSCEMAVPVGDSEAEKAIRFHELLHAGVSPAEVPMELISQMGISRQAIRLAEEVRVNCIGRYITERNGSTGDIRNLADGTESATANEIIKRKSWNEAVVLLLTTLNTSAYKNVRRKFRTVKEWRDLITQVEKYLETHGCHFDARRMEKRHEAYHVARWARNTSPVVYKWIDPKNGEQNTVFTEGFQAFTLPLAIAIDQMFQYESKEEEGNKGNDLQLVNGASKRDFLLGSEMWETMIMGSTTLTEPTASFISKRRRPAMTGKFPSRPDRMLTDPERRIFRETVRSRGGVVGFDCSGSMGVSHEVVRDAVKQFAGATVLVYSHVSRGKPNAWVVAKNGRMISEAEFDELPLHHGNGIDAPALRWALRQRRSNKDFVLWVSDGQVTGRGDTMREDLVEECAHLSLRHNIIGVDTCHEALQLLADMKRTNATPKHKFCRKMTTQLRMMKGGR